MAQITCAIWCVAASVEATQSRNLVPVAFQIYELCVRAGLAGEAITESAILGNVDVQAVAEAQKGAPTATLSFEIGEHFRCQVVIDPAGYDPKALRLRITEVQRVGLADTPLHCGWGSRQSPLANFLTCNVVGVDHPDGSRYSFRLELTIFANGPGILLFRPSLVFGPDGRAIVF